MSETPLVENLNPPSLADGGAQMLSWMKKMRAEQPVLRDNRGIYNVLTFDLVKQVMTDPANFSNDQRKAIPGMGKLVEVSISSSDPPYHGKLRGLVNKAFAARRVFGLEPRVLKFANELWDAVEDLDEFDLVSNFAIQLPSFVISELLGVSPSDRKLFIETSLKLFDLPLIEANLTRMVEAAVADLTGYLVDVCRKRRADPRDDLISALVTTRFEDLGFDDEEAAGFCLLLLLAGFMTVNAHIGNTVLSLTEFPDEEAKLRADRSLIPAAVEEILRYRAPLVSLLRTPTRDLELAGVPIPKGAMVLLWIMSANRDERHFTDPDRLDVLRNPNTHIVFGHGIHSCLGAQLARLEGKTALSTFLERFASFEVDTDNLEFYEQGTWHAKRIPIRVKRNR